MLRLCAVTVAALALFPASALEGGGLAVGNDVNINLEVELTQPKK